MPSEFNKLGRAEARALGAVRTDDNGGPCSAHFRRPVHQIHLAVGVLKRAFDLVMVGAWNGCDYWTKKAAGEAEWPLARQLVKRGDSWFGKPP